MRGTNTSAWLGTMGASSLVFALLLLIGGLRAERGAAAAAAPLPNDPSSSAALISLTSDITPTLAITIAEPVRLERPAQVVAAVTLPPTQTYRVNFATTGLLTNTSPLTGSQRITRTFSFTQTGPLSLTVDVLGERLNEVYTIDTRTITFTVIDPTRPTTLSLTAAPTLVAADGTSSATLTATVVNELGEPIRGTPVRFTSTLAPPTERQTNAAGVAVIGLTSPTAATAEITAIAVDNPLAKDTISVVFASPAPQAIQITQQPSAPVVGDGQQPVDLSIRLLDQFDKPVPNTPVRFSTDLGTWGSAEPYSIEPMNVRQAAEVITTSTSAEGYARVKLTAPVIVTDTGQTTATINVQAGNANDIITVSFTPVPNNRLNLTVGSTQTQVCPAGSTAQRVPITASLALDNGIRVSGQPIQLRTSAGSFSDSVTTTTSVITTDAAGSLAANVFVRTNDFSRAPTITVTAQFGQRQQSVQVVQQCRIYLPLAKSAPVEITFDTSPNVGRLVEVNETIPFTATIKGGNNQPVEFETTAGTVNPRSGQPDTNGKITGTLTLTSTGVATITAKLQGGVVEGEPLVITAVQPQLSFVNPPDTVETGSATPLILTLKLVAANGQSRVLASRPVGLTVGGGGTIPSNVTTDANGQATATYTAPANTGPVTITAQAAGAEPVRQPINVVAPARIATATIVTPSTGQINAVDQEQPITVAVKDSSGNPIRNRALTLRTSLSSFANGQQTIPLTTDASGQVRTALRGIAQLGPITIEIRDGAEPIAVSLVLQSVPAACPDIEPDNNSVLTLPRPPALGWLNGICTGRIATGGVPDPQEETSDYYAVSLEAGQTITVDLTNVPAGTNYDLFLYPQIAETQSTGTIASSRRPGNQNESFTFRAPRTERYYIRVFAATKAAPGAPDSYTLTVRTQQ